MTASGPSLVSRRYRALAVQLTKELGSQRKAAARVGCPPSSFSEYFNGQKHAESRQIERAVERLGISRAFFDNPSLGDDPDYHQFVRHVAGDELPDGLERYIGRRVHKGKPIPPDEIAAMADTGFRFGDPVAWERVHELVLQQKREAGRRAYTSEETDAAKTAESVGLKKLSSVPSRRGRR